MAGHFNTIGFTGLAFALAACGSGSGNSHVGSIPASPATPTTLPNPLPAPVTSPTSEDFNTAEYQNSSAAIGANVLPAWQAGASGKGITLGFVDTGIVTSLSDFSGRISPLSTDVNGNRPMGDVYGHGTAVAGIAAAAHDGKGMEGIAYEATIFMAKADQGCPDRCNLPLDAVADGIDAARKAGAKVINLSIAGNESSDIRAAAERAVNAGAIVVIGAGNAGAIPSELARQLASLAPEQVIIVGGLGVSNPDGTINYDVPSIYTSGAGSYQSSFLMAPGWLNSASYFKIEGSFDKLSGTSFAAPVVTGAVALIAQAFPMLSAKQIVLLLYRTADDLGAAGMDATFGRGRLNIGRAFQPVGTVRLAGSMAELPSSLGNLPSASGDAAHRGSLKATILDSFDRPFNFNLATSLSTQRKAGPLHRSLVTGRRSVHSAKGPVDLAFLIDASRPGSLDVSVLGLSAGEHRLAQLLAARVITRLTERSSIAFGMGIGASSLQDELEPRIGETLMLSGAAPSEQGFQSTGVTSLAYQHKIGSWLLSIAGEKGSIPLRRPELDAEYTLVSGRLVRRHSGGQIKLGASWLVEPRTLLGGSLNSMFGNGEARTWFADIEADQQLGDGWSVAGAYRRGWTIYPGGYLQTSAMSLDLAKAGILGKQDALTLRLSQPLRVQHGMLSVIVPVAWDYRTEVATEARRSLSLAPSGRELFVEVGYSKYLPSGSFGLHGFARRQPGHVRAADPDIGIAIRATGRL